MKSVIVPSASVCGLLLDSSCVCTLSNGVQSIGFARIVCRVDGVIFVGMVSPCDSAELVHRREDGDRTGILVGTGPGGDNKD